MKTINKIKLAVMFNSLHAMGAIMFRLILMIIAITVIYHAFNGGLNIKINDKNYQFQVETKGK